MSFIERDFLSPARLFWNKHMAIYRQFKRAFPEITVDGIQVYSKELNLYNNGAITDDRTTKRFLLKLGVQFGTLEKQDYDGIKRLFMTFDSQKYNYVKPGTADIMSPLAVSFNVDDTFSIKIAYGGDSLRRFSDHASFRSDINLLIAKLDAEPLVYYAGNQPATTETNHYDYGNHASKNPNYIPPVAIKAQNNDLEATALLDNGTYFERTGVRDVYYKMKKTATAGYVVDEISFIYDYKVIKAVDSIDSVLITNLDLVSTDIQTNMSATGDKAIEFNRGINDTNQIRKFLISLQPHDDTLFYNGYLRVASVAAMKKSEFVQVLAKTIKIDYEEEDTPWWQDVLMVVLIIAVTIMTAGMATAPAVSAATGWVLVGEIATILGTASLFLQVGLMIISILPGGGNLGSIGRFIGKVAQVLGTAAAILGAFNAMRLMMDELKKSITDMSSQVILTGARGVKNLYSIVDNLDAAEAPTDEPEQSQTTMTAGDIIAYQQAAAEPDALHHMNIKIEKSLGLNKTEAIIYNQSR